MTVDGGHGQLELGRSDVVEFVRQFLSGVSRRGFLTA